MGSAKTDKETIRHVAGLARISLSEEEIGGFASDFAEILKIFSKLDEIDTRDTEPSFHPIKIEGRMREDSVGKSLDREEALSLTRHRKNIHFKGPRTIL